MEIAVASTAPAGSIDVTLVTDPPADALAALVADGEVSVKRGEARLVTLDGNRAVTVGAGPHAEVDADTVRDGAAAAIGLLQSTVGGSAALVLDASLPVSVDDQARAAVEGAIIGSYDPGAWKTSSRSAKR